MAENKTDGLYIEIQDDLKKKMDKIKEAMGIPLNKQVEDALPPYFEKMEKLMKDMKKVK